MLLYCIGKTLIKTKQNVLSLMHSSDLLIQPSLEEGMSSTLLEAMGCGTCILASNIEGISEIVENEKTGVLVEPNNSDELLNKIFLCQINISY